MAERSVDVMIVDDHKMFAESLSRLLADDPEIRVVATCAAADDAFALAGALRPAVAIVDYVLPGEDGVALARRLKEHAPEIQVIMLTGSPDDHILLAAIEAGCSGFLTKERAAAEVAEAVHAVADGEALISPEMLARLLPQLHRATNLPGADLTERERELLACLARGLSNRAIASELFLSVNTVRNYVQSILHKLGAHSKLEAVSLAVRAGIITY
jgi:DNA-binding NarL/FixJ family response regulator